MLFIDVHTTTSYYACLGNDISYSIKDALTLESGSFLIPIVR